MSGFKPLFKKKRPARASKQGLETTIPTAMLESYVEDRIVEIQGIFEALRGILIGLEDDLAILRAAREEYAQAIEELDQLEMFHEEGGL